jgi:serine/threonine-protein kinase
MLGPYEILAPIGAGGMGEVYKAKDTRLDRTVAIKVLPSHLADNPDLKQRFEREARAVSSLNHPHICTLYEFDTQDGTDFLVMEYIEGESLADRLKKGALPLDQALRHAIEIADALDKAHRQGVVHRDLKPGNIMLTKSGAKLLDFGLAKLKSSEPGQEGSVLSALPTEEKPLTEKGSILGTFQYMAPEQLEGKESDARTDIFAFGAVLYEMVTRKKAFEGKSQASLISAIMTANPPPISKLQSMSPRVLDHVIQRCLAKDPDRRWQTAADLMLELEWIGEGASPAGVSEPLTARPSRSRLAWGIVAGLMVGAIVTGITVWNVTRPGERAPLPLPMTRFAVDLPATDQLDTVGIALSEDGRDLVYIGTRNGVTQLYRRSLDQLEAVPIGGTEDAEYPFFSPDGKWVGFFADGKLKKVSLAGGPAVTLCDAGYRFGASWGRDDVIVFAHRESPGLMQVPASGGAPEYITTPENEQSSHRWLDILPGGNAVLFTVFTGNLANARIEVQSLETGERRLLLNGAHPRYAPTGHIVFARVDSLWAVPFDADQLKVTGLPNPILDGVQVNSGGLANFALAGNGSLVYVPGKTQANNRLVWVDREGNVTPLTEKRGRYRYPRLSPDGQRLAVQFVQFREGGREG